MTMMELATAMQYHIQVKLVILSNHTLGLVRQYQHYQYHDRYSMTSMNALPNLKALSEAYGMDYLFLSDTKDTEKTVDKFLSDSKSVILECAVDPNLWA